MWFETSRRVGFGLAVVLIGLTAGCSARVPHDFVKLKASSRLLFAPDRSTALATQIGRSDWPATFAGFEGPEDTIYLEYYRDNQGSASLERSNPQRLFRSYRIGTQHR